MLRRWLFAPFWRNGRRRKPIVHLTTAARDFSLNTADRDFDLTTEDRDFSLTTDSRDLSLTMTRSFNLTYSRD